MAVPLGPPIPQTPKGALPRDASPDDTLAGALARLAADRVTLGEPRHVDPVRPELSIHGSWTPPAQHGRAAASRPTSGERIEADVRLLMAELNQLYRLTSG